MCLKILLEYWRDDGPPKKCEPGKAPCPFRLPEKLQDRYIFFSRMNSYLPSIHSPP